MTERGVRHPPQESAASSDGRSARPSPRAQREYFLDQLYLVLKERADRRQRREERRVLDRADGGRRPVNQQIAESGADDRQLDWQILESVDAPADDAGSSQGESDAGGSRHAAIRAARSAAAESDTSAPPPRRDALAPFIGMWTRIHWAIKAGLAALLLGILATAYQLMATPEEEAHPSQGRPAPIAAKGTSPSPYEPNLRALRRQHIERFETTPEIVLLGGDQWQAAGGDLLPRRRFYNAHVAGSASHHDLLALTEVLIRAGRLPQIMIVGIDAATFLPAEQRASHGWQAMLPDSRAMAEQLGLANVEVEFEAVAEDGWLAWAGFDELWADPTPSIAPEVSAGPITPAPMLDLLQADGSLRPLVTHPEPPGRPSPRDTIEMALDAWRPPAIEPEAVRAVDRLIGMLIERGVRVVLANPPLHPLVYREVANGPSAEGLHRIEATTARLAEAHGTIAVGSFDPGWVGCEASMFIDAEHGDAACLDLVFDQIPKLRSPLFGPSPEQEAIDQLGGTHADPAATGMGGPVEPGDDAGAIGR